MEVWAIARMKYGKSHSPVDHDPNSFEEVYIAENELTALRVANEHGLKAYKIELGPGEVVKLEFVARNINTPIRTGDQ